MKKIRIFIISIISLSHTLNAQQQTAKLLKQPVNWEFERFTLPPQFAPSIPYHGIEELRFSPGMFHKDSSTYFTYAFVAELNNVNSISQDEIKNYVLAYYKGLCNSTAKQRKLSIDTSKITVAIDEKGTKAGEVFYNVVLNIFGVFADGATVTLNMEIKVLTDKTALKVYLVFIASPHEKTDAIWKELYTIQKEFTMP